MGITRVFRVRAGGLLVCGMAALLPLGAAAGASLALPAGCEAARYRVEASQVPAGVFPPPQFDIRTPVAPRVLPSAGRNYLIYELHLQNFGEDASTLHAIEVFDADGDGRLIGAFRNELLGAVVRPVGAGDPAGAHRLASGAGAIAFLCIAFERSAPVPKQLRHRVVLDAAVVDGPAVQAQHAPVPVLGRPVAGAGWSPANGPHAGSHHRFGLIVVGGRAQLSRRYAVDWKIAKDGQQFSGDPRDVRSYYSYGAKVFAVGAGTVVEAKDGFPDNIPRTPAGFTPAVPVTLESIAGNTVVIDLGNGAYASYSHLQPGSLRVKPGQRVTRGQLLGRIGNSGDARWPHLHFQVTSSAHILDSEGLPFVIDHYRIRHAGHDWETRQREFPWGDDALVDFGPDTSRDK